MTRQTLENRKYPTQFWLMFFGMLISTIGSSMVWPFLMIFVSERLGLPRAVSASLLTINSAAILLSSFFGGPIVDRLGRRWVMVIGLFLNGVVYFFYARADTYLYFAVLLALSGIVNPLFRIGADAMLADLVPAEKRIDAYALMRLSHNLGIALGPTIGGFIASASYNLAFYLAASGMAIYSFLLIFRARETMPAQASENKKVWFENPFRSYASVWQDKPFLRFLVSFTLVQACAVLIWMLLPIHAKETFQVSERLYGFIPTTNAVMVVSLQLLVTRYTKKHPPIPVMAIGAIFYALSNAGIALSTGFQGFWVCMVIMSLGELLLLPTSSTYVATLAPADKRGRYMSLYGLTWGAASGIAPIFGGILNDLVSPQATWIGGFIVGICGLLAILRLQRQHGSQFEIEQNI